MIIRIFTLFSLFLLVSGSVVAQSNDEELRYYDVELVIFKNVRAPKGNELILPVSSPLKDKQILDLSSPKSIKAAKKKSFSILKTEQLRLQDQVRKIVKSPYYELLTHVGWRQPGLEKEKAMSVWIRGGRKFSDEYITIDEHMINLANSDSNEFADNSSGIANISATTKGKVYELEGKITIVLARYLHTYTDLVLRRPRLSLDDTLENPEQMQILPNDLADTRILNNHSMKERRRMRSKSLHYLDSPEFSLLVLITPYQKTAVDTAAAQ